MSSSGPAQTATAAATPGTKAPLRRIELPSFGPEDVVVDGEGAVWTGTEDGCIYRIAPDETVQWVANTGGRPLGLELLGDDRLLIADADAGLLTMDFSTGVVEPLVTEVEGRRMVFCNNAAVARNTDIWFSDSSRVYPIARWKADFVEDTRTGRLLRRRAAGEVEVHLDGLRFANGVALAPDESYVCVAESVARTVVRLWLTGPKAGTRDLFVDDLPGYPDNIALGSDGLIWVTIASPLDPVVERLRDQGPLFLRKAATRLPERLQPRAKRTARVQAYDAEGRLVHDVDADASEYHMVVGVREHHGRLWVGSLEEGAVGVVDLSAVA